MVKVWWRRIKYRRAELGWFGAIVFAALCVLAATLARILLGLVGSTLPFATYFPAVLLAALIGGRIAGLIAIPMSVVVVWWAFIEPFYEFGKVTFNQGANFLLFTLSSLLVVALAIAHRQIVFDLEDQERSRELLFSEIEHRNKNLLAVMTSLVNQTITDKHAAETLVERMRVVADNHNLLDDGDGAATGLRELFVSTVQKPYGGKRIVLTGPDVRLSADQARSLRLVFHEMATNAMKYGALSEAKGRIQIDWLIESRKLTISWCEQDGPKAAAPRKYNFGSKLITTTLKQMHATLEPNFAETGYCYKISFTLD
jgi:two-component sensor histidine kinase